MKIPVFALERYFAQYEFSTKYLLSCSDCQTMPMHELAAMASEAARPLWDGLELGYTETMGHPALRRAIADLYPGLAADNTLVAAPEEGVFLFMNTLLEAGDHVVCISPAYQSLHEVARAIGCEVSDWVLDEQKDWAPDLADLEKLLRPETRLVVINFPHNPTGAAASRDFLDALYALLDARGTYLLSDEMYRFLYHDQAHPPNPACGDYPRAVTLGGLSKAFGLPGLRLGWLATQDMDLLEGMSRLKDYTTICHSAPSEILGIIALENREAILDRQTRLIRENLEILEMFLKEHEARIRCVPPKGGSMCFPRLTFTDSAQAFCENLVRDTGVMLVPSTMFRFGDHHVRMGIGRRDFPKVLEVFSSYLAAVG
ncbi:Aminotransferase class I and II [Desulfatibacillum alkenivorans DSM 16219]|jgi:aspartate/methionine/tyrosine aminotransferase|uniref:Aminotransferase n=1 Tax=Desulfatibacillum alkenivorans DSM 16219 TaxID=1121393 RepID=A0A1M6QNQ1_9BACT|nr:aminotransferase class I/II-fold pyridoxal phosphate-dependent enzyme [Desulfatibacillum alkenivorans]SHK21795.1 Aminotransferase class I and II [Desulfatibacillum alkenivorans DSM 16219]